MTANLILMLSHWNRDELNLSYADIINFCSNIDIEYGIMLSASVLPYMEYMKYKNDLPYYANIALEGVVLNA